MSLVLHLPLTTDTKNYGTYQSTPIAYNLTASTGKLGPGYLFNGTSSYIDTNVPQSVITEKYTICCWARSNVDAENYRGILGFHGWLDGNAVGFSFGQYTDGTLHFSHYTSPSYYTEYNLAKDVWVHLALVYDSTNLYLYINGLLIQTQAKAIKLTPYGNFIVGKSHPDTNRFWSGSIQDLRVYNDAISAKEIYEMSKGLLVHYNFNQQNKTKNLLPNPLTYTCNSGTMTVANNEYSFTADGSLRRFYIPTTNVWTKIGETFTFSCWAKTTVAGSKFTASRSVADFSQEFALTDTWTKYIGYITTRATSANGTVSIQLADIGQNICIRDMKLESGKNALADYKQYDIEYDTSGFKNDGTVQNSDIYMTYDSSIDRYVASSSGNTSAIIANIDASWLNSTQVCTMNMWVRPNSFIDSGGYDLLCQYADANISNGKQFYIGFKPNAIVVSRFGDDKVINKTLANGIWQMVTVVNDNFTVQVYINGSIVYTGTHSLPINIASEAKLQLFADAIRNASPSDISISDFKLYSSALTDYDILDLYKTKGYITNTGTLISNNITEASSVSEFSLSANSVANTKCLNEIVTLEDGSKWVCVLCHDNRTGSKLFKTTDDFTQPVYYDELCWANFQTIENYKYNSLYEFMILQEADVGFQTSRWTQTNNPCNGTNPGTVVNINGITSPGLIRSTSPASCYLCFNGDGWWWACGSIGHYNWDGKPGDGIPGMNGKTIRGIFNLYIRVYNPECQIFNNSMLLTNEFIEQ